MTRSWRSWWAKLGLASVLALGGALAIFRDCALAQIVPDATLGAERSVVTPNAGGGSVDLITGGATRGANLFHSFGQFSVLTGRGAHFNNSLQIQNIISRVTGGSVSNIDGLLRANGTANLFLINPNGIIFGPNASLNIGGSFVASTANSLKFADGSEFSAKTPATSPLLTVSVPIGLQYGVSAGSITNTVDNSSVPLGLQVQPGKTLALVGGDVSLDSETLIASGGRVELGGLTTAGTVGLNVDSNNLSLSFPPGVARSNVSLANGSSVDVAASGGGSIAVNAQNLDILGGSILSAGISTGSGAVGTQAGDITLNATGAITLSASNIFNSVESKAVGNAGNININAGSLSLSSGTELNSSTYGQGNAGSVFVQASDSVSLTNSNILSSVQSGAVGNGGEITLNARSLSLDNSTQLATSTLGQGNAGNIQVNATDSVSVRGRSVVQANTYAQGNAGSVTIAGRDGVVPVVEFDGTGASGLDTSAFTAVGEDSTGKGGDVNITAKSLSLTNGAKLTTDAFGKNLGQDAGNIRVNATDSVTVSGGSQLQSDTFGQGNAGNVTIQAGDRVAFDGVNSNGDVSGVVSRVGSVPGVIGERKGGDISITSQSLSLTNGAELIASTYGQGNAGSVFVQAKDLVSLDSNSYIFSNVESGAVGNSGTINIKAGSLSVTNGAELQTLVRETDTENQLPGGIGNAGNVNIEVRDAVTIAGVGQIFSNGMSQTFPSGVRSQVNQGAKGSGGNINISAKSLSLSDGADLVASTYGQGNAGSVFVQAADSVSLDNGIIFSTVESGGVGNGGNITINAGSLSLVNSAQLITSTYGQGTAGSVFVQASDSISLANSYIFSDVESGGVGNGGSINIKSGSLSVTNGAQLQTLVRGADAQLPGGHGNAGNVNIDVSGSVTIAGNNNAGNISEVNSVVGFGASGNAGNVFLKAQSLSLSDGAQILASTSGNGDAGNIQVKATDSVSVSGTNSISGYSSALFTDTSSTGRGGNITVDTSAFRVSDGAILDAETTSNGRGGDITVNANTFEAVNGGQLLAATRGSRSAGNITVNATGQVNISGSDATYSDRLAKFGTRVANFGPNSALVTNAEANSTSNGGDISIKAGSLSLSNGAQLSASTYGQGNAGSVFVQAKDSVSLAGGGTQILTLVGSQQAEGKGGNIGIQARSLSVTGGAELTAQTLGGGDAGNIQINATDSVELSGVAPFPVLKDGTRGGFSSGLVSTTEQGASGQGGSINVTTGNLRVANGSVVNARTRSAFRGGNITVNANSLEVTGGGQLLATAFSSGDAGNITLNVNDRITISGSDPTFNARFNSLAQVFGQEQATATIDTVRPASGLFANTAVGSTGSGGSIFIDPSRLTITDGAGVAVDSLGSGRGGSLKVQANYLTLDNRAFLSAIANSGEGGNITLTVPSLLETRHNSQISATAGTSGGRGNGGNIDINTRFLVALPSEDSDITANAAQGRGGNIRIAAQGIFGIQSQQRDTPQSDITANSQFGINGTVQLSTLDINPTLDLVVLPANLVDAAGLIAQSCPAGGGQTPSQFIITGRGGLPPNPSQTQSPDAVLTNWNTLDNHVEKRSGRHSRNSSSPAPTQIVEANGWVIGPKGEVILTAQSPSVTPNNSVLQPTTCNGL